MATLYIDNKPYEVQAGKNLLETCLTLGLDLPYFCWHPAMGSVGACRQCAIKVFKDGDDKKGRLIMSCMEPVIDNQRISIKDEEAYEFRGHITEWLMTNHPHDCAVCDEGGSCHLQDMTVMTGHAYRRFQYKKRTHQNQHLGPFINHEMNRCIQCYRCVRFYKDYAGGNDLDVFASKGDVYFGRHEDGVLESEFSGNLTEVCPTGVFTDKTLKQHYTRKWDLTTAPSICQHCSLGCNIIAGERYGELRSITSRYNGQVNGYFICDRGRFGYEFVNAPDRIRKPLINHQEADKEKVMQALTATLQLGNVIGIGSPRASLQSNFALKALVGDDNFYHGVSDKEHDLSALILRILREGSARTPTMKEVEKADVVFVLGEDLTNTAPMLALAVRQSARQQPLLEVEKLNIPLWNDAAARELIQDQKGPIFIATTHATKLDDIATESFKMSPSEIAQLGFAVANLLDSTAPADQHLTPEVKNMAQKIADSLSAAKHPVVISGSSCGSEDVIKAAANVSWALTKRNNHAGIVLTVPECNSLGLAMLGGRALPSALEAGKAGRAETVIILENDLYRHGEKSEVDEFLKTCAHVIVLDHTITDTIPKANFIIPAGSFAESDGVLINNEGRAQRFFQVYESKTDIQESWRWLLAISMAMGNNAMMQWKNFEDITHAMVEAEPLLKGVDQITPPAAFRINGQRVPREPHRYSGRTAMLANINVSEPKPPEDPDSPLSYTMEGMRGEPPSTMIPFFWSPGWNSVQSINKYQQEVGGALRGGDPGIRLFEPAEHGSVNYFTMVSEKFVSKEGQLLIVPLYHIFGSEELSARSRSVEQRLPEGYIMVSTKDAIALSVHEKQSISFDIKGQQYQLPVRLSDSIPSGVAGLPNGLKGLPYVELPAWGILNGA